MTRLESNRWRFAVVIVVAAASAAVLVGASRVGTEDKPAIPAPVAADGEQLLTTRWESSIVVEMNRAAAAATRAGVQSTPAFQIGPTGGRLELVAVSSLGPGGIRPAIEAALAR
jgi:hypothetical protein